MVTLDEIRAKIKIRLLLKGGSASGKTYTSMKIVNVALKADKKVLYLDHERSAAIEIGKYFEENNITELKNFIYEDYFNIIDLIDKIKKYVFDSESKIDLLVIDPLPLQQLCRITAGEQIKKQGFYYMGEKLVKLIDMKDGQDYSQQLKEKDIDNKNTYALRGWQYQIPNDWELSFKYMLVSVPVDIVVTLLTPDIKNTLDPSFDYVVELSLVQLIRQNQKVIVGKLEVESVIEKVYKGIPRKIRGESKREINEMEDPWKTVIKPFCRKYLNRECNE